MFPSKRTLLAILCAMASPALCGAQIPVSFSPVTSRSATGPATGGTPSNIYAADLNNDGVPDLIQDVGGSPAKFTVSLARGDGTFKAPVEYYYPGVGTATPRAAMAFGDFNGDGNIDVVTASIGTRKVGVYLGNGDGILQAPKINTVLLKYVNPTPDTIDPTQVAAVDLNRDGRLDLILAASYYVYGLPGNGDGTFATPAFLTATDNLPGTFHGLVSGDFDGDGNVDVAFSYSCDLSWVPPCDGVEALTVVYGDGKFENWGMVGGDIYYLLKTYVPFVIGAGDLNGDGRTDLIAIMPNGTPFVSVLYGQADRTFKGYASGITSTNYGTASGLGPQFAVGDFNGDRYTDFATLAGPTGGYYLDLFLGTSSPGKFTTQAWNLPHYASQSNVVAGLFNRDLKPDVALVQYNSAGTGNSVITTGLNATRNGLWSNCPYPLQARGISLCSPTGSSNGAITSPVNFNAAAHSFGEIRDMDLWVDGKQVTTQHNVWENNAFFSSTAALAAGAHQGEIHATDIDGTLQQLNFDFTVGAPNCSPPTTNAVRICSLVPSSSEIVVQAAATVSGTLARMEVWADGRKVYTEKTSPNLSASIGLTPGTHQLNVVAANTSGTVWNQAVTVTVP